MQHVNFLLNENSCTESPCGKLSTIDFTCCVLNKKKDLLGKCSTWIFYWIKTHVLNPPVGNFHSIDAVLCSFAQTTSDHCGNYYFLLYRNKLLLKEHVLLFHCGLFFAKICKQKTFFLQYVLPLTLEYFFSSFSWLVEDYFPIRVLISSSDLWFTKTWVGIFILLRPRHIPRIH